MHWSGPYDSKDKAEAALKQLPGTHFDETDDAWGVDITVMSEAELLADPRTKNYIPQGSSLSKMARSISQLENDLYRTYKDQINSRKSNAKSQLKKVYKEFNDAGEAYGWMMNEIGPMDDPIATIKIDGKVGGLRWDSEGENLILDCHNLPYHEEVIKEGEWAGQLGEMFDYINQQIRKYGE
jgi:hypothetical protein